jgi:hypothetical protein
MYWFMCRKIEIVPDSEYKRRMEKEHQLECNYPNRSTVEKISTQALGAFRLRQDKSIFI